MNGQNQDGSGKTRRGLSLDRSLLKRLSFILVGLLGVGAALVALTKTDDDPVDALLAEWPVVLGAGLLYLMGMVVYSISWAALFEPGPSRRLIALGFLISQPIKYLPGGIAQPIGQVTLTAQVTGSSRSALVAFPVHVLVNVVAAVTLGAPILFVIDLPSWAGWLVVLVPITWAALDRRWMSGLLGWLGRLHRVFAVGGELPAQPRINRAFALGLGAHATMFASFGLLTASSVRGWSALELSVVYAVAWLIGYIAIPAPAGLGARETVLAVILSAQLAAGGVVRISAVHRIATLVVELLLLVAALILARGFLGRRSRLGEALTDSRSQISTEEAERSTHD